MVAELDRVWPSETQSLGQVDGKHPTYEFPFYNFPRPGRDSASFGRCWSQLGRGFLFAMKLIIAGGRDYKFTLHDFRLLDWVLSKGVTEVVSGGAQGADAAGERWAESIRIPVKRFPADWTTYGRFAGPRRNRQMAEYADALALFPGGKGTANMMQEARAKNLQIYDFTKR